MFNYESMIEELLIEVSPYGIYFSPSQVLEAILALGSELWMFNEVPEREREKKLIDGGLDISSLVNIKIIHREGNAVIRRHLESLPLETFDSVSYVTIFIHSLSLHL